MSDLPKSPRMTPRARHLAGIVKMLSSTPSVRRELVDEIQRQVEAGDYVTEEKLDVAIGRMLEDILR